MAKKYVATKRFRRKTPETGPRNSPLIRHWQRRLFFLGFSR